MYHGSGVHTDVNLFVLLYSFKLIFITKHTLLPSMRSCIGSIFHSKMWYRDRRRLVMSEYVKNSISKNWSNVRTLTSTDTICSVPVFMYINKVRGQCAGQCSDRRGS